MSGSPYHPEACRVPEKATGNSVRSIGRPLIGLITIWQLFVRLKEHFG